MRNGFILDGHHIKPNPRIATIEITQGVLGLRICDVLKLTLTSFIKDGNRYRLDIVEKKTQKERHFTVPIELYSFLQDYAIANGISPTAKLFDISERQVERHLSKVFKKMDLPAIRYSCTSFRKMFATEAYLRNGKDIKLVQTLLQHSSPVTTQRYIGLQHESVENALAKTVSFIV